MTRAPPLPTTLGNCSETNSTVADNSFASEPLKKAHPMRPESGDSMKRSIFVVILGLASLGALAGSADATSLSNAVPSTAYFVVTVGKPGGNYGQSNGHFNGAWVAGPNWTLNWNYTDCSGGFWIMLLLSQGSSPPGAPRPNVYKTPASSGSYYVTLHFHARYTWSAEWTSGNPLHEDGSPPNCKSYQVWAAPLGSHGAVITPTLPLFGVEPNRITYSPSAGIGWDHIHWTSWTPTSATATGDMWTETCLPNCELGKVLQTPGTIKLSDTTVSSAYALIFNKLTFTPVKGRVWVQTSLSEAASLI